MARFLKRWFLRLSVCLELFLIRIEYPSPVPFFSRINIVYHCLLLTALSSLPTGSISGASRHEFMSALKLSVLVEEIFLLWLGLAEETYCSAFLSCWLCLLALPLEPHGYIRASVSKMASCIATGTVMSLAIPVLANIYKGLSIVASSTSPSTSSCCFPSRYLFYWMGVDPVIVWEARGHLDKCHPGWTALRPRSKGLVARPSLVLKRKASLPMEVCSSLSGRICTEVMDNGTSHVKTDEVIPPGPEVVLVLRDGTCLGAASAEEHPACMDAEVVDTTTAAPSSIQHIESIFRNSLRVAWVELCSLVEGRSHEALLAVEESILASFKAPAEFSRPDLSYHGKKLKAIFSKARRIKKVQSKAASSKIRDKFIAARASTKEFSSKLLHEEEFVGKVHATYSRRNELPN
ncbi:hypothetical protein LIER_18892 [Lithospermum erythrorhizon]|uniref:Uncharacterized protein n=1 Tax=Lithospermum erythrorhizon TaxID=34254 RepID=A0AAV3QL52_LITER